MSDATSQTMDYQTSQSSAQDTAIPLRIRDPSILQRSTPVPTNATTDLVTRSPTPRQATPPPASIDTSSLHRTTLLKTYPIQSSDRTQQCRICTQQANQFLNFTVSYLHPTMPLTSDSVIPVCSKISCGDAARLICASQVGEKIERHEDVNCGNCGAKARSALCGACKFSRELSKQEYILWN